MPEPNLNLLLHTPREHTKKIHQQKKDLLRNPVTHLPNRFVWEKEMERAKFYRHPIIIIIADVDKLKETNDYSPNHHIDGDQLLERVSIRLKNSFRPEDLVAHTGGDEFSILVNITQGDPEEIARQLHERLSNIQEDPFSFGIAVSNFENFHDIVNLIKKADNKMYDQKRQKYPEKYPQDSSKHHSL